MTNDYASVTEVPGLGATQEQLSRIYHRYAVTSQYCDGKRVLEVACGSGIGLGYLEKTAALVVGGDYTPNLLAVAANHHKRPVNLFQLDAHVLPFKEGSFDTVVLLEALYYLQRPDMFLQECRRVLSNQGVIVICTVNKDWVDFNPSPFSTGYYSPSELFALMTRHGFQTELFGAFPVSSHGVAHRVVSLIRRTAVALNLIPGSMKGKQWLKRIFYGNLTPLPTELDHDYAMEEGVIEAGGLTTLGVDDLKGQFKIFYAIGTVQ